MKSILISGDSWGIGEYQRSGSDYAPTGHGLESIFKDLGYSVTNVSKAGCSNNDIVNSLTATPIKDFDIVLFLQTDAFREHSHHGLYNNEPNWRILDSNFITELLNYNSLADYFDDYYNELYLNLSNLDKEIYCIGGWSMLHPSIASYENLIPIIPSATRVILKKSIVDCYISDFEWIKQLDEHESFMAKFGHEFKQIATNSADKFDLICREWNDVHPTAGGYQILADNLVKFIDKKIKKI